MRILLLFALKCFLVAELSAQELELVLPAAHNGEVTNGLYSPDGKLIATVGRDKSVKIWEAQSGYLLKTLTEFSAIPTSLQFHPKGNKLLIAAGEITIWNLPSLKKDTSLFKSSASNVNFYGDRYSPTGRYVTTATEDGKAIIYEAVTGNLVRVLDGQYSMKLKRLGTDTIPINQPKGHPTVKEYASGTPVFSISVGQLSGEQPFFSFDEKFFFTAGDSSYTIWEMPSGKKFKTLKFPPNTTSYDFTDDQKYVVINIRDTAIHIMNFYTGEVITRIKTIESVNSHVVNDRIIILSPKRKTADVWDVASNTLLYTIKDLPYIKRFEFSPNGKTILGISQNQVLFWNAIDGRFIKKVSESFLGAYSPDSRYALFINKYGAPISIDLLANIKVKQATRLLGRSAMTISLSPDGQWLAIGGANIRHSWDMNSGKVIKFHDNEMNNDSVMNIRKKQSHLQKNSGLLQKDGLISYLKYSVAGSYLSAHDGNGIFTIYDSKSRNLLYQIMAGEKEEKKKLFVTEQFEIAFNYNDSFIVTTSYADSILRIWNAKDGRLITEERNTEVFFPPQFQPGGSLFLVINEFKNQIEVRDCFSGSIIKILTDTTSITQATFSHNGNLIAYGFSDGKVFLYDIKEGIIKKKFFIDQETGNPFRYNVVEKLKFSKSDSHLVAKSGNRIKLCDILEGEVVFEKGSEEKPVFDFYFSEQGWITKDNTGKLTLWDPKTALAVYELKESYGTTTVVIDGLTAVTNSEDNVIRIWDLRLGKLRYALYPSSENEYLTFDSDYRYDGTSKAREQLYFTCGTEVIELEQLKEQLWVPNLAERIVKGDSIHAPKISELNLCGFTPQVEHIENKKGYSFQIIPRRGGLGQTILYVNGIETKKYNSASLTKKGASFELLVSKRELEAYFVQGNENTISVKAYTKENDIFSRGAEVTNTATANTITPPNLYAVIIGVSDYKGDALDLKFAAKDATDLAGTLYLSAAKLLGKEHVFLYNLNTAKERYAYPEKKSIKEVFNQIAQKAFSNDILFVFFAGHGVVDGTNKQFYFLSADAGPSSLGTSGIRDAGISTEELTEWMKPDFIKAQKRILVLDACNSGQAIRQMVSIGKKEQNYLAARSDDKGVEIRQIDKLNEKAGLYIFAASASNQSAYELGSLSQGILTYSLLKTVKERPDILEDSKYLNVSNWFNASAKTVADVVRENNLKQEPQLITTTNFNIGIVDGDVLAKIQLPDEKPLFSISNFQNNDAAVLDDDLNLSTYVNQNLNAISARSTDNKIVYINASFVPNAWSLVGRYEVSGDEVTVRVNIKHNNTVRSKFEVKGKKSRLDQLAAMVVAEAVGMLEGKINRDR